MAEFIVNLLETGVTNFYRNATGAFQEMKNDGTSEMDSHHCSSGSLPSHPAVLHQTWRKEAGGGICQSKSGTCAKEGEGEAHWRKFFQRFCQDFRGYGQRGWCQSQFE
ncbi:hypothetical protein EYC84_003259 [Monilinia fructicola]|uniref:Uncharacterized protein n=1 Tax=Monilinia fructicola TaxID=38448 RepID=A0A5M9K184_MONFR|nr:hypothetical protein EYC84_003259 [Monilinia fructicola]